MQKECNIVIKFICMFNIIGTILNISIIHYLTFLEIPHMLYDSMFIKHFVSFLLLFNSTFLSLNHSSAFYLLPKFKVH